ncbi:MAG: hypothetical protein U5R46_17755 [Gammaproteobacteria bacterium]|nr:hypothetical protein [Gammaproteobacteria bacterium]
MTVPWIDEIRRDSQLYGRGGLLDKVLGRFAAGLKNLEQFYMPRVDAWVRYDNSGGGPIEMDWSEKP